MFKFLHIIDENLLASIKIWHILIGFLSVSLITIIILLSLMLGLPKYNTYLEIQEMRREVLWVETHAKLANTYGPIFEKYPEYGKFLMYQQNDDLESIGK